MKVFTALLMLGVLAFAGVAHAQVPGSYLHPDFRFEWALTDSTSPAYTTGATWQQAIYKGFGKYGFFASYSGTVDNTTWYFFGFTWNATTSQYDVSWRYDHPGMSNSLEANERMIVVGDWNNDGKQELILGVDPEGTLEPNLLVFEPGANGDLPTTPTALLVTPKAPREFGNPPASPSNIQQRFSWSSPPCYVRDIDKSGKNAFVGCGYEGIVVGKYDGAWSDPNAVDNVVWTYVDSVLVDGSTVADLMGDGRLEIVNASPTGFGPTGQTAEGTRFLPGTFRRDDYFTITTPNLDGTYTTTRMASPTDSIRMANGYKAYPAAFRGGFHGVTAFDIDGDGKDEVFVADWFNAAFWMIDIGSKAVADIDSNDFHKLADVADLFTGWPFVPNPMFPQALQHADMNGNGKEEFYAGSGPYGTTGGQSVIRIEYQGGDPTLAASWHQEVVYQDTTYHLTPRQVLAAGDLNGNGKEELVITNAGPDPANGGSLVVLEDKSVTPGLVGNYLHPDFRFEWSLTDPGSPAYTTGATWQQAIYKGFGKYGFFASYSGTVDNTTWYFFGFTWNATTSQYDVSWRYDHPGMSNSLEANERMIVVGDWNNDGKQELILGVDPEGTLEPNLLVFEPGANGDLPTTPTALLVTPKAPREFGNPPASPSNIQQRFSWSSPPCYVRDIDKSGKNAFVGCGYEGIVVGKYDGAWSDPNAVDNVVWTYVDSVLVDGSTVADLMGDGRLEIVNASPTGFGPTGQTAEGTRFLPGTFRRDDYFTITTPNLDGTYTTTRMASPTDSIRMANGYKAYPAAFRGGFHGVTAFDIDGDGKDEVFVADWFNAAFWMIDIGSKAVADIDSNDFHKLADVADLFTGWPFVPNPMFPQALQHADMNGNGKEEFYAGSGPYGTTGGQSVIRIEYQGGDPTLAASWHQEVVYQDTTYHLTPRQVLAAGDLNGNGKEELVITNAGPDPANGGSLVVLESKSVTTTDVDGASLTPETFALSQNYPNPFNPSTKIAYSVPKEMEVKIFLYNVLGQKIAELVNQVQEAGSHVLTVNAGSYSSGVYFYMMQAGSFVDVKKLILMK